MRRTLATLTASAVLIPLAVTAMPGAASAATNTLTVHVYDRAGAKVKTYVYVTNLSTGADYTLTSNKARKLPKGTYIAGAEIQPGDGTSTLGARTVKVSGTSSTVIDGRNGRLVEPAISPAVEEPVVSTTARICVGSNLLVHSWGAGRRYVIPNSSEKLRFTLATTWQQNAAAPSYTSLDTVKGLPKGYRKTVQRSSLVPVKITARAESRSDRESQRVYLVSKANGCAQGLIADGRSGVGGFSAPAYLTPGKWQFQGETTRASSIRDRTLVSGGSYSVKFFSAGRGPSRDLPYTRYRTLFFESHGMFTDPGFAGVTNFAHDGWSHVAGVKTSTTLTKGGKTLQKQTLESDYFPRVERFTYPLKTSGWYGLTVHAKRTDPPAGQLSYRTSARFRFHADPKKTQVAPVYLTRFTPAGLNLQNAAGPGSSTDVTLTLERQSQNGVKAGTAPKVKTMTAWASYDNGATWKKTTLKKSGSKWVATVKNPKSGYVTLRAKVTDTKGNSSDITIYRAYKIA
ncbi:hypothetical protein [Melissospora conviva]|uniref:hypothetical protein n=1 Tax=Melissospora conviva TaxID=3388432 RepID=UPI003C1CC1D6